MARISRGFASNRLVDITIEEGGGEGRIFGGVRNRLVKGAVIAMLREAVSDIADAVEEEAKEQAPANKDPDAYTWRKRPGPRLKDHPVDRSRQRRSPGSPSHEVIEEEIRVTKNPFYAVFVHEGTFAHGPARAPHMRYKSFGRWHKRLEVAGQDPNPYLTRAYLIVDREFVPIKLAELRAKIAAIT